MVRWLLVPGIHRRFDFCMGDMISGTRTVCQQTVRGGIPIRTWFLDTIVKSSLNSITTACWRTHKLVFCSPKNKITPWILLDTWLCKEQGCVQCVRFEMVLVHIWRGTHLFIAYSAVRINVVTKDPCNRGSTMNHDTKLQTRNVSCMHDNARTIALLAP